MSRSSTLASAAAIVTAAGFIAGGTTHAAAGQRLPAAEAICHAAVPATFAGRNPAAPAAEIRVDQVGYPTDAPKLAELMLTRQFTTRWVLVKSGSCAIVAHGRATADLGSWSGRYSKVLQISFARVRATGRYRLGLSADPAVTSPWFLIAPPSTLYAQALANELSFYQNERDGPGFIRSALRSAPGNLNDGRAMTFRTPPVNGNGQFSGSLARFATGVTINANGGWFDAGDYLKFVETTSYTVAAMLQGIRSFPTTMGGRASFVAEARFGLDFLQRMWHQRTRTLYYQVGTGSANNYYFGDHDIWRLPQADDRYHGTDPRYRYIRHPPVFRAGRPGSQISPNLAGRLAADFALCYRVFRLSAPRYAGRCLRSAETIYALADTHRKGQLLTVIPFGFYPETSWRDDMMLGATELAIALHEAGRAALPAGLAVRSPRTYLLDAARWARAWIGKPADRSDTLNLYDVSALADYELYRAIGAIGAAGLAITRPSLLADLRGQIQRAIRIASADPFRFGFAWNQYDTTAHGLGLAVSVSEYDALVHHGAYAAWGQRWLDDVLGANAWGVSLIVGDGTVFPDCMQHQVANLVGSHDGRAPVLAGAVVEGPNSFAASGTVPNMRPCVVNAPGGIPYSVFNGHQAVFADNVQSYSTVEPAIDLTALAPMAFAWQEAGASGGY